jgi:purine nucleoside permease
LIRAAVASLVDFARIVVLRIGSDFDRAPPCVDPGYHLTKANQGGFQPAIQNIVLAGRPFVDDVVNNWDKYEAGVPVQIILAIFLEFSVICMDNLILGQMQWATP